MSRPSAVRGTKWTPGRFSRASMRAYSMRRWSRCQRGRPSSILPYGRGFCSKTTTSIPWLARMSAAVDPADAPPKMATMWRPGDVLISLDLRPNRARPAWVDVDDNTLPAPLTEAHPREQAPRDVPRDDGAPDVGRLEHAHPLEQDAQAQRDHQLRDERDVEGAAGVARPLQGAGIRQGHGDEQARHREVGQQLAREADRGGVVHAEHAEEQPGDEHERGADERRDEQPDARADDDA